VFSACLAWHWPDHHWQCNWQVARPSSRVYAGKRRTFRATIVTIFNHMTRDVPVFVKCDTIFRLFFWKLPQFHTSKFCKVVRQHTEGTVGRIIRVLLEIYLAFQQWKNFKNPLRIDKVIAMSLVYYFFGTQCTMYYIITLLHIPAVLCQNVHQVLTITTACSVPSMLVLNTIYVVCRIHYQPIWSSFVNKLS